MSRSGSTLNGYRGSIAFTQGKIGSYLDTKNRLVKSATYEAMATKEGQVTDKLVEFYKRIAEGGVGLIITGLTYIQKDAHPFRNMTGAYDDTLIPGLRKLSDEIHKAGNGCKIAVQICHPGREIGPGGSGGAPICPTSSMDKFTRKIPRMMSEEEIQQVVHDFAESARRVYEAGFDAIQLHGAHGYLLSQFLSPHINTRRDRYGGPLENRMRILSEIYVEIVKRVGRTFPLLIKLNGDDLVPNGLHINEAKQVAKKLEETGYVAIEVSAGIWEATLLMKPFSFPPEARTQVLRREQEAYNLPYAKEFKKVLMKTPVILVGGLRSFDLIDQIISQGWADYCALARPLIREPDLPIKWLHEASSKSACVSCNQCGMKAATEENEILRCHQYQLQ